MLNKHDLQLQHELVAALNPLRPWSRESEAMLLRELTHSGRLPVYQESFSGRTVAALAEAMLEPAQVLVGADTLRELMARYVAATPPKTPYLGEVLREFPAYLRRQGEGRMVSVLAAVVDVCLARWDLVTGRDPRPQILSEIATGMTPHSATTFWRVVHAGGDFNLHDIFAALDAPSQDDRMSLEPSAAVGVLLFKDGPASIVIRPIPD